MTDPVARLTALLRARPSAQSSDDKKALAAALAEFALKVHFQGDTRSEVALSAYDAALELRREAGDRRAEADLLLNRAETLRLLGRTGEARANLSRALIVSKESSDTAGQQAAILQQLGDLEAGAGHYDDARAFMDRSLALRQKEGIRNGVADCLRSLGQISFEEGQYALARKSLEEAIQIYASLGNAQARAAALGQLGDVALAGRDFHEASGRYAEGLATWQEAKQDFWVGKFLARQARLALEMGDINKAERVAQESLEKLLRSNAPKAAAWARIVLGEVALRRGQEAEGTKHLKQAQEEFNQLGNTYALRLVNRRLANF